MRSLLLYIVLSSFVPLCSRANDTLIQESIPMVIIVDRISDISEEALLDTADRISMMNTTLADALNRSSLAYVKTYYPGGLSSVSIKGSSSSHSNLLWNGFPLNSPMNGQPDYFLVPTFFFERISLSTGALSDGIGGDIHLKNTTDWNTTKSSLSVLGGSFDKKAINSDLVIAGSKLSWKSSFAYSSADNNYRYSNVFSPSSEQEILKNAGYSSMHIKEKIALRKGRNVFELSSWINLAERRIPPIIGASENPLEHQKDQAVRTQFNWTSFGNSTRLSVLGAYFNEWNFYRLNESIASNHRISSYHVKFEFSKQMNKLALENEVRYNFSRANSTDLPSDPSQHELQWLNGVKWLISDKVNLQAGYRLGSRNMDISPFSPFVSFSYLPEISNNVRSSLNLQLGRKYRLPTLNDQFWFPGGNPDLDIEKAWHVDLILQTEKQWQGSSFKVDFNPYLKWVKGLIVWSPQNGIWRPENLKSIFKRGYSVDVKSNLIMFRVVDLTLQLSHTYTKATTISSFVDEDASVGKQLLYVPKHQITAAFSSEWKNWGVEVLGNYISKRYNSSDNTSYVSSMFTVDTDITRTFRINDHKLGGKISVYNILNRQNQSIALRPMPGRNFDVSILYFFEKNK